MSLQQKLRTRPDEWNHPQRARRWMPAGAGIGGAVGAATGYGAAGGVEPALVAGVGAGLGGLVGWVGAAVVD